MSISSFAKIEEALNKHDNDRIGTMTIGDFAKACNVSVASVTRYAKKRGFLNYKSFQAYLNKMSASIISVSNSVNNSSEKNKSLNEMTILISSAKRVICIGMGSSSGAANEMSVGLNKLGYPGIFFDQVQNIIMSIPSWSEKDVIVIFSENAKNKEIKFILSKIKHLKCKAWLVGNYNEFPNVKNIVLNIEGENHALRVTAHNSIAAQNRFVNTFLNHIMVKYDKMDYAILGSSILDEWNRG